MKTKHEVMQKLPYLLEYIPRELIISNEVMTRGIFKAREKIEEVLYLSRLLITLISHYVENLSLARSHAANMSPI